MLPLKRLLSPQGSRLRRPLARRTGWHRRRRMCWRSFKKWRKEPNRRDLVQARWDLTTGDQGAAMSMVSRADAYQRRHRWAGLPLAVLYKFADDQGTYLAAQITYYGFVALFPLLLLLATILGYALHGNQHLQRQVLDSALTQFPVIGDQITANIRSFHGSLAGLVIGMLGCVYGGLGIVQAVQSMLNKVWGVPRDSRPNPLKARLRSLLLLIAGGASVIATTVLSALGAAASTYGARVDVGVRVLATAAAVALN